MAVGSRPSRLWNASALRTRTIAGFVDILQLTIHDVSYLWYIVTQAAKFLISQQKYLELLEAQELNAALVVLRSEVAPLNHDPERLQLLSRCVAFFATTHCIQHH
jgi:hypothetical protein